MTDDLRLVAPPAPPSPRTIESSVIEAATTYAVTNGYPIGDRRAAGLLIAGIVLAAELSPDVLRQIADDYGLQHPTTRAAVIKWANWIERADR